MLKKVKKYGIILSLFSVGLTSITSVVHQITKTTINKKIMERQQSLFDQVIPRNLYDNRLQKSCYIVQESQLGKGSHRVYIARREEIPVAVVMEVTAPDGYSGNIHLLVGSDFLGTILGTRVIEHHETPGLGDKIDLRLSDWILHFTGKTVHGINDPDFSVKKDGGNFDQFTGATITPRAVVNAVKHAGMYARVLPSQISTLSVCKN